MAPLGKWIFFAATVDTVIKKHCGVRYYLNSASIHYNRDCRDDDFYKLTDPNTIFNVGGVNDPRYPASDREIFANAYATLQYVRLCLDYVPTTQDEFLDLATMESACKVTSTTLMSNN